MMDGSKMIFCQVRFNQKKKTGPCGPAMIRWNCADSSGYGCVVKDPVVGIFVVVFNALPAWSLRLVGTVRLVM